MNFDVLYAALARRLNPTRHPRPWDLPSVSLDEVVSTAPSPVLDLSGWTEDRAAGGVLDGAVLALIGLAAQPTTVFEIGTGFGRSATLLAQNLPKARFHTLSLPGNPATGRLFHHRPCRDRITQLEGDSATFDYTAWYGRMDFVLVDGCHESPLVDRDTVEALRLRSPRGWILWHDVAADCPDVIRALRHIGDPRIRWIRDSRYAVLAP